MPNLNARRLAACVALLTGLAQAASAAEILIVDAKSQPESLTVAPGGILIVGSASTRRRVHRRTIPGRSRALRH